MVPTVPLDYRFGREAFFREFPKVLLSPTQLPCDRTVRPARKRVRIDRAPSGVRIPAGKVAGALSGAVLAHPPRSWVGRTPRHEKDSPVLGARPRAASGGPTLSFGAPAFPPPKADGMRRLRAPEPARSVASSAP